MYMNLHTLPAGQAMFTLYVARPNETDFDEYDVVAPATAPESSHLTSQVILKAKDEIVRLYGPNVEVRVVINQSSGAVIFASGWRGYRPIPVVLPDTLTEAYHPDAYDGRISVGYDVILDLCRDEHDGLGGADYLDALLGQNDAEIIHIDPLEG